MSCCFLIVLFCNLSIPVLFVICAFFNISVYSSSFYYSFSLHNLINLSYSVLWILFVIAGSQIVVYWAGKKTLVLTSQIRKLTMFLFLFCWITIYYTNYYLLAHQLLTGVIFFFQVLIYCISFLFDDFVHFPVSKICGENCSNSCLYFRKRFICCWPNRISDSW